MRGCGRNSNVNTKFLFTCLFTGFVYTQNAKYQSFILLVNEVNDKYRENK